MNELKISEAQEIQLVKGGKLYSYFVGQDDKGTWLAFTNNTLIDNNPRFLIECDSEDDAKTVGYLAMKYHFIMTN